MNSNNLTVEYISTSVLKAAEYNPRTHSKEQSDQLKESIERLKGLKIKYALGGHKESDFTSTDLIIRNPDVPKTSPYLEIAKKNNINH